MNTADEMHALGVAATVSAPILPWSPISTMPMWGTFLVITVGPDGFHHQEQMEFLEKQGAELRKRRLRLAVAWCHLPALPPWIEDATADVLAG